MSSTDTLYVFVIVLFAAVLSPLVSTLVSTLADARDRRRP